MENLVKKVFDILENNLSINEKIVEIENFGNFGDYFKNESEKLDKKYPMIDFEINFEDDEIIFSKIVNEENFQEDLKTPLEKLFYSIVWKQGDLTKIKHILKGIKNESPENAFVFHQFGKFLNDKKQPIIDQHVLRAFDYYKKDFEFQKISEVSKKHENLIREYKNWILETFKTQEIYDYKFLLYKVDRILFLLGKFISIKNKKS